MRAESGTHTIYIIKLQKMAFLRKKPEKTIYQFTIMKQFEEQQTQEAKCDVKETYNVHQLLENPKYFPFNVLENNGKFIPIIGQTMATQKKFNTLLGAKLYIRRKPYELILAIVGETFKMLNESKK